MSFLGKIAKRSVVWFGVAMAAGIAFAMMGEEIAEGEWDKADTAIELAIHKWDTPFHDVVMKAATVIGSSIVLIPAVILVALLALRAQRRRVALVLAIDTFVAIVGNVLLKLVFTRARPTLFDEINQPASYSFPSGHSMSAVAIWGAVAVAIAALWPRSKLAVTLLAVPLILMIGLSRVYLGVHWPSDVAAGFAAGLPLLIASAYFMKPRAPVAARATLPTGHTTAAGS